MADKERPYSLEQIAAWLGWKHSQNVSGPSYPGGWQNPETGKYGDPLPNFYDPEHNWRVRDAVKAICKEKGYRIEAVWDNYVYNGFNFSIFEVTRFLIWSQSYTTGEEELAWIEALAELKRLEKEKA